MARRLAPPDGIILTGALGYLGWSLVPAWYRAGGGTQFGIPIPATNFSGWRGTTLVGIAAAILAIVWVGIRLARTGPAAIDLALGACGLVATALGAVVRPAVGSWSWGLAVGLLLACVWAYGAQWRYREGRIRGGHGFGGDPRP